MAIAIDDTELTWRRIWQAELLQILRIYRAFKQRHAYFFLLLLAFFFLVNAVCYWLAVVVSFPELLEQQLLRMAKIQQPVALLGGLFDSLSFFITVWLIHKAAHTDTSKKFVGILSVDLIIAAVATAWVLFVVMMSSWLIGPPDEQVSALASQTVQQEQTASLDSQPSPDIGIAAQQNQRPGIDQPQSVEEEMNRQTAIAVEQEAAVSTAETEGFTSAFYQNLLIRALQNPLENIRYFVFAIVMGLSTLLPTLFHVAMGLRSFALTKGRGR